MKAQFKYDPKIHHIKKVYSYDSDFAGVKMIDGVLHYPQPKSSYSTLGGQKPYPPSDDVRDYKPLSDSDRDFAVFQKDPDFCGASRLIGYLSPKGGFKPC